MEALLKAAKEADSQIAAIHSAFGAPGDYGYESREGKALFALYKCQVELRDAIAEASKKSEAAKSRKREASKIARKSK